MTLNIVDNLQYLETHYINVWIKKWQTQLETVESEAERSELQVNIDRAKAELKRRKRGTPSTSAE